MPNYQSNNLSNLLPNYPANDRSDYLTYYQYNYLSNYLFKQGQSNQCQTPGVKFKFDFHIMKKSSESPEKMLRNPEKVLRKS